MTGQLKHPNRNLIGWLLALILMLVLLMTSCSPEFYCSKCPSKDSIYVQEIVHDTVLKTEFRDLVIHDTVPCADFELNKDSNGVKIKIVVKNHYLTAKCDCEGQLIKFRFLEKHTFEKKVIEKAIPGKRKCNFWLPFILGNLTMLIVWQRKRILGLILRLVKPI